MLIEQQIAKASTKTQDILKPQWGTEGFRQAAM
jgi:hypothetical protein